MDRIIERLVYQLTYHSDEPLIFSSGLFLMLFLGFTFVYMLLQHTRTLRLIFVTAFSYYFYYKSSGFFFWLLAVVTVSDFLIARILVHYRMRALVALSLIIDLGFLGYFKYTNFFCGLWADLIGNNFQPYDIFLPVGISFFTFQSMSYVIDVYRGHFKPLNSLLDYAFYVSFFPQLVAGPIVRARDFAPQIRKPLVVTDDMFARGVYLVMIGLFKKAVISDYISLNYVDRIFDNPAAYTGVENLLGVYGYALQIYCDFSGYSDMAIGLALLLGFQFPMNFNAPYRAQSISDFWHRWHISLSSWIREYVYFSLGGNKKGRARTYFNIIVTMLLGGLWHGASLTFIMWGGMHGVALAVHKWLRLEVFKHGKNYESHGIRKFLAAVLTFHFVAFCWIFFRSQSFSDAWMLLGRIFTDFHSELFWNVVNGYNVVFALIVLGYVGHFMPKVGREWLIGVLKQKGVLFCAFALAVVVYFVVQVKTSEIQPFIYFQF